mgnify:CR=1 FL=1
MKSKICSLLLIFFLTSCASGNKFGEKTCKDIHGQFTKSVKCLELKFVSLNPKKNEEYTYTYDLILKAIANQVYESRIDNIQAWLIYEDIILGYKKSKDKQEYLNKVLSKYS